MFSTDAVYKDRKQLPFINKDKNGLLFKRQSGT